MTHDAGADASCAGRGGHLRAGPVMSIIAHAARARAERRPADLNPAPDATQGGASWSPNDRPRESPTADLSRCAAIGHHRATTGSSDHRPRPRPYVREPV